MREVGGKAGVLASISGDPGFVEELFEAFDDGVAQGCGRLKRTSFAGCH